MIKVFCVEDDINIRELIEYTLTSSGFEVEEVKYATAFEIKTMAEKGLFHPRTEWINVLYNYITKF